MLVVSALRLQKIAPGQRQQSCLVLQQERRGERTVGLDGRLRLRQRFSCVAAKKVHLAKNVVLIASLGVRVQRPARFLFSFTRLISEEESFRQSQTRLNDVW